MQDEQPSSTPSLVVLKPIRKKEPHCYPPTPVILCERNQEGTGRNECFRSTPPKKPRPRARICPTTQMVPKAGLEPARLAPHAPQTCVSAISPLRQPNPSRASPFDDSRHGQLARGSCIIEVGQNPCQSIDAPVESGGVCSPAPPTPCTVSTVSHPHSMRRVNGGQRDPSPRCSTSTTHSCREKPARYDSSGFYGGAVWSDGAS